MSERETPIIRPLTEHDAPAVRRLLASSDYTHYRFTDNELPDILRRLPAVGAFDPPAPGGRLVQTLQRAGDGLRAFLLIHWLVKPSAWIGGFGVVESESRAFAAHLDRLLPPLEAQLAPLGAKTLYYSGSDLETDWLRESLEERGFALVSLLRSYDKDDFSVPAEGAQHIIVRPFQPDRPGDMESVLAIEAYAFDQLWRHDAPSFREVAATYPYFVVAEDAQGIVGYQFNTVDAGTGYLVRIAVHPRAEGHGVGTRLLAEATRYFERRRVWRIALNTEEANTRAHRLYERFGFRRIELRGFALGRDIPQ